MESGLKLATRDMDAEDLGEMVRKLSDREQALLIVPSLGDYAVVYRMPVQTAFKWIQKEGG